MSDMTPEAAAKLRAPFRDEQVGKLPKPYKADSPKANCRECGGYHGLPAVHLDYVGHAATTDRLLQVDPAWTWEPLALDHGLPLLDRDGNLWIRLTVLGVTRLGVGDGKSMKERIGDAIRNASMRFGVALDLWAKEDLSANIVPDEQPRQPDPEPPPVDDRTPEQQAEDAVTQAQAARERRNAARRSTDKNNARGRAWDAVTECEPGQSQDYRSGAIIVELKRRSWPDPQSLSAEHWLELAHHYEEKADDDIRARYARGE